MPEKQLLGRICRCPLCQIAFSLCQSCDRRHWYCSCECAAKARRVSLQRAAKAYRRSETGRQKHCQAQRRYRRKRLKDDSEIYQSSARSASSLEPAVTNEPIVEGDMHVDPNSLAAKPALSICHRCQRRISGFVELRRYPKRRRQFYKRI